MLFCHLWTLFLKLPFSNGKKKKKKKKKTKKKKLSGILSECQTVWIQIRPNKKNQARCFVMPDLGPNCVQRLSADEKQSPLVEKEFDKNESKSITS